MTTIPASDSSLLVVFGDMIAPELRERVVALFRLLQERRDSRIRNLHPGYASLLIDFDPLRMTHEELRRLVEELSAGEAGGGAPSGRVVEIPVCYDAELGPDLAELAAHAGLPVEQVVKQHSAPLYSVYFLGFSPGFAYLGGLPEALHMPRLATPRKRVPAGAVGIAGSQTGVYPVDSPGGWRLIGRTPQRMFDPQADPPTRLQPGDSVKFVPINRIAYDALTGEVMP